MVRFLKGNHQDSKNTKGAKKQTKPDAGAFQGSCSCSGAAPLRMKTTNGYEDGPRTACLLPPQQAFRRIFPLCFLGKQHILHDIAVF